VIRGDSLWSLGIRIHMGVKGIRAPEGKINIEDIGESGTYLFDDDWASGVSESKCYQLEPAALGNFVGVLRLLRDQKALR
jgi:hypothetical protein